MSKYLTEDGDEVEAFTGDELAAKIEEAKKEVESNLSKKIEEKEKAIEDLNKKLEGKDDKDKNFANLREAKEALEKGIREIESKTAEEISKLKIDLNKSELKKDILIRAGGNKEMAEKIELHYNAFQTPKDGEEDKRLENAILLATGGKISSKPGSFSSGIGASPSFKSTISGEKMSEDAKNLGRQMGLSDEELK